MRRSRTATEVRSSGCKMTIHAQRRKVSGSKGFTLVELLVVIAIMAILAAVVVPVTVHYVGQYRAAADVVYTEDVAKWAESCAIAINERSEVVDSASICREVMKLYGENFPYALGYTDSTDNDPDFSSVTVVNADGTSNANPSPDTECVVIRLRNTALTVFLYKDGAIVESEIVEKLIAV